MLSELPKISTLGHSFCPLSFPDCDGKIIISEIVRSRYVESIYCVHHCAKF